MEKDALTTERLVIKPYARGDAADMTALLTNEIIKRTYMLPDFPTPEGAAKLFERLYNDARSEKHYERGIYLSGRLIGFLNDVAIENGDIELGYVIHPDFHNQGYASEALRAAIGDLFARGYRRVIAGAFEANEASFRVMRKCGMRPLDRCEDIAYRGQTKRCLYYAVERP